MRQQTEPRAGFALIEVLAALVITALFVAVVLPFVIHLMARWATGEPDIENADAWMQAIERLTDDVAEAVPIMVAREGRRAIGFQADPELVKLVRPSLGGQPNAGLEIVTYSILRKPAGDALVRRARAYTASDFDDRQTADPGSTILDGPFRLRFSVLPDAQNMPRQIELAVQALTRARAPAAPIVLPIAARGQASRPP